MGSVVRQHGKQSHWAILDLVSRFVEGRAEALLDNRADESNRRPEPELCLKLDRDALTAVPQTLSRAVAGRLDGILRNEADIAFKRRIPLMLRYLDPQPTDRILDCGCGMGFMLRTLSQIYDPRLIGVDGRMRSLRYAQAQLAGREVGLVQCRLPDLPVAEASVDKVVMTEVLEHLDDDLATLRALLRVLRPGGRIAITVPNANYPFWWDPINKTLEALTGRHVPSGIWWLAGIWADHVRLYTAAELERVLRTAGFEVHEVLPYTHACFPFHHMLVYGIGKNLIERNLLPGGLAAAADRFRGDENAGSSLNPVRVGLRMLNAIDRRNDRAIDPQRPHVGLAALAFKPA